MHEFAVAQRLQEIVEQEALPYGGAPVTRIWLRIGQLSSVVPEALRFAFAAISRGGIAEGAALEIEEVPLSIRCRPCEETFVIADPFLVCPRCAGIDVEMISGRELEIKSMEIENGDKAG
jgi:hydrogenase nickel incorporation protein HypA/HybF